MSRYESKHRARICLPCRLHLCRIPVWVIRGLVVTGIALDLLIAHSFGMI
jgi:hypothetical protein